MAKFLINKSHAHVSLRNNTIVLAIGGNTTISDADAEDREVIDAVRRGWVDMVDAEPAAAEPFVPKLEFENAKPQGSLTIPGKEPVAPAPVEEAKVETKVEEPAPAPAPKKGKKAAAETEEKAAE